MKRLNLLTIVVAAVAAFSLVATARADVIDNFTGTALDPAWTVTLGGDNATAWSHSLSGGELHATDITDSTSASGRAYVTLTRPIVPSLSGDFEALMDFDWDNGGDKRPMDLMTLGVEDSSGNRLAEVTFQDSWYSHQAAKRLRIIGETDLSTGKDTVASSGNTTFSISRSDGYFTVDWGDGSTTMTSSSPNTTPATTAVLEFAHYKYADNSFNGFDIDQAVVVPGQIVLNEPFQGNQIDPAWTQTCTDTSGPPNPVHDDLLEITELPPDTPGDPSVVFEMSRELPHTSDFVAQMDFAYDSKNASGVNTNNAMQNMFLYLDDASGNVVASVAYVDAWVASRGRKQATAGASSYTDPSHVMPYESNGFEHLVISRLGDDITVKWNDTVLVTGTSDAVLGQARLFFQYYDYPTYPSHFGTETVDFLVISGTIVPEPGSLMLFCLGGLLGLGAVVRRRYAEDHPA